MTKEIVSIRDLSIRTNGGKVLVNDISLRVGEGEILGIIGESGSGKTLTAWAIASLLPDNLKSEASEIIFAGHNLNLLSKPEANRLRGAHIGFIPQNTSNYLHPLFKIKNQMIDGYRHYHQHTGGQALEKAARLLGGVGFDDPERVLGSYPWELSGGMKQRVMIAMAMMNDPKLLIADEPTSALDGTTRKQVMDLLTEINRSSGVSVILISHDLGLVRHFCHRIIVLYAGRVVESGIAEELFRHPAHPYTDALIEAIPSRRKGKTVKLAEIPGNIPESNRERGGCIFFDRCRTRNAMCTETVPLQDNGGHRVYCHFPLYRMSGLGDGERALHA